MKYDGPKDMLDAARSSATLADELTNLANSEYVFVRVAVAENPNTPIQALSRLVPDKLCCNIKWKDNQKRWINNNDEWRVVLGLLNNPNLPCELFLKISEILKPVLSEISPRDYYPIEVIKTLASSISATSEAVLWLSDVSEVPRHIRSRIANPDSIDNLLKRLAIDSSERVRKRALNALAKKKSHDQKT
jgi:hypothetical protein